MIAGDPTYSTPAELGDLVGFLGMVVVVLLVMVVGMVALIRFVHRDEHVESFAEDFIYPTRDSGKAAKWVRMRMRNFRR